MADAGWAANHLGVEPTVKRNSGLIHLGIVYVLWGTTFLAIRTAVREGSGFPPFSMAGSRVAVAGLLLLLIVKLRKVELRPTAGELLILGSSGLLLWTGGNGLVTWAEQRADSGFAALIIATVPILVSVTEALLDRQRPSLLLMASLVIALAGVGLLSLPALTSGVGADLPSLAALLAGAVSWTLGTVLQKRRAVRLGFQASSAYQHLAAAVGFFLIARLRAEPAIQPAPEAWAAWGYLIVFGSIVGYSSYVQSLRLLPLSLATTNSFVNPVIAVFLGWLVLGEQITPATLAGAALVLAGVAGVFRDRYATRQQALAGSDGD